MEFIQEEKFVPIIGYEGFYEISNYGTVKSLSRLIKPSSSKPCQEMLLKPFDNNGYLQIMLRISGVFKTFKIHRLVASHFVENPFNKQEVNHIDGVKGNNAYWNLEWCTRLENEQHSWKIGLKKRSKMGRPKSRGSLAEDATQTINQYDKDMYLVKTYSSVSLIHKETGYNKEHVENCIKGYIPEAYGFIWVLEQ